MNKKRMINIGLFCTTGTMGVHNSCDASLMSPTPTPSPTWTSTWTPTPFETSAYSTAVQDSVTVNLEGVASTQEEGRRFSDGAGIGGVAPGEMGGYFSPSTEMGAGIGGIGINSYVQNLFTSHKDRVILGKFMSLAQQRVPVIFRYSIFRKFDDESDVINEFYGLKKSEAIIKLIEHNNYIQIGAGGQYISPDGDVIHGGDLVSREYFEDVLRTQALYIPPSSAAPRIDPSQWNAVLEKYRPILAQKKIPVLHWRDMVKEFKHQGTPPLDALYYAEHLRVHLMAEEQLLGYMLDGEMIKDYIAVVTVPFLIGQEGPDGRKIENADYILKEYLQHP